MSPGLPSMSAARAARILGVGPSAGAEAVRAAYRAAVKRCHPDRPGGDAAQLRAVIEAYACFKALGFVTPSAAASRPAPAPMLDITPTEALNGARRLVADETGCELALDLPPGLRAGDLVRVGARTLAVAISSQDGLAVIGDHLCLTVEVEAAVLRVGGTIAVGTPLGERTIRITRQDGVRGLARIAGKGLPATAARPRGDLLLRLLALEDAGEPTPSETQDKLRRFAADWAA